MTERQVCARCGTTIKRYAGSRLCPSCLLRGGLPLENTRGDEHSPVSTPLTLPHSFGDYELLDVIAQGGMGIVYRARQKSLNRIVAVKMLLAGEFALPKFVERFRAEAEVVAQLQHPNIVAIHEIGEQGGQPFFSMDYVEGRNLAQVSGEFKARSAEVNRCAGWLKSMAEAVHYAHQRGIIHRDLKPSNVLIDAFGQPRITDFGLAKRLTGDSELTLTGQVLGSPNYLPPEQASGKPASVGSDIYSLGAILYHLLTGRPPFEAESLATLLRQVVETEPVAPRTLNPGIPRDLETIALKCLEKEPHRRYQTAKELAEDLARFLEGRPIQARAVTAAGRIWKWSRRRPSLAALGVGLLLTLLLGSAGVLWQWRRAATGELLARQNAQAELQQRQRAEASEYAADMHLAQLALSENNRSLTLSLLDKYRPKRKSEIRGPSRPAPGKPSILNSEPSTDLRGWEWRYLWQLCQGDESSTLHRYPKSIDALVVSKDGKLLALATGGQVSLWDPSSKRQLIVLSNGVTAPLALDQTGKLLAMGNSGPSGPPGVVLWDVQARKVVKALTYNARVRSVSLSQDGKLLATFDNGGGIEVRDWASERILTNVVVSLPRYTAAGVVVFSPDGRLLAIGEDYGRVRLLDLRKGSFLLLPTQLGVAVTALAFSPTGDRLAAGHGYGMGTIRLWDVGSGEICGLLTNHTDDIRALAFTPDGKQLVSASRDWTIRMWDVTNTNWAQLRCLWSSREGLTALAVLPDKKTLVSGGSGGTVCFWDATANDRAATYTNFAVSPATEYASDLDATRFTVEHLDQSVVRRLGLAFTPDSERFITMNVGGAVVLGDARSLRLLEYLPAFGSNHWGVALSPDGHWLVTGDSEQQITVWDWATRQPLTNFALPFEWCGRLRFSHTGHYLMAVTVRNNWTTVFRIWRTGDWVEVPLTGRHFQDVSPVDLSPDDRVMAVGHIKGALNLFRFPSLELLGRLSGHFGAVSGVLFSPNGRDLHSTDWNGDIRLWDTVGLRETATPMRGHLGVIMGASLSPDGRRLVSCGLGTRDAVKLWDLTARREILSLPGEGIYFMHPGFSPDGSTLTVTALSGMAHLWRAPSWEEIEAAESKP